MLYFTAPYEDRERIQNLGAEWDFSRWVWKVENPRDYRKFSPWVRGTTIAREIFILEARDRCPYCQKPVKLVALGVGGYTENFGTEIKGADSVNLLYGFENIDGPLCEYLVKKYPLKKRYHPAVGYKFRVNGCPHCDRAIPDEYLFIEPSSPFVINSQSRADALDIYGLSLEYDLSLDAIVTSSAERSLFSKGFKKISDLQLF